MGTGIVPRYIPAPEECPGAIGHQKGAQAYFGNVIVPWQIWAPDRCPGTYEHQNGARAHIDAEMVL